MNKITFDPEGHKYFNGAGKEVPSCSRLLSHFGISNFDHVPPEVLKAAALFGSNVHETTHLYDVNDLAECDPAVKPYLDAWHKYKMEAGYSLFEVIEEPMYSKTWGFAGTPDRYVEETLIDIKSGSAVVSHKIQTALYKILLEENGFKVKHRICVYLGENKFYAIEHKDKTDLSVAKSLIQVYKWKEKHKCQMN